MLPIIINFYLLFIKINNSQKVIPIFIMCKGEYINIPEIHAITFQ